MRTLKSVTVAELCGSGGECVRYDPGFLLKASPTELDRALQKANRRTGSIGAKLKAETMCLRVGDPWAFRVRE